MIKIDLSSQKKLRALQLVGHKARKGAEKGWWYVGRFATKIAAQEIRDKTKKTGRFYIFKGKRIRASAPGEYPAKRTGDLARSLGWDVKNYQEMQTVSRLDAEYPKTLELGSQKIARRSYLARTARDNVTEIKNILEHEIEKEIRKG